MCRGKGETNLKPRIVDGQYAYYVTYFADGKTIDRDLCALAAQGYKIISSFIPSPGSAYKQDNRIIQCIMVFVFEWRWM